MSGSGTQRGDAVTSIKPVTIEYSPVLAALHQECFPRPWSDAEFISFFEQDNVLAFVAIEAEKPVGFFFGWLVADDVELLAIGVLQPYRQKGVGRALLQAAVTAAKQAGAKTIYLEVGVSNESARTLYMSCGFEIMSRRARYYHHPDGSYEDAITMRYVMTA